MGAIFRKITVLPSGGPNAQYQFSEKRLDPFSLNFNLQRQMYPNGILLANVLNGTGFEQRTASRDSIKNIIFTPKMILIKLLPICSTDNSK
jgi:hypothetical protein